MLRRILSALALSAAALLGASTAATAAPAYVTGYHYYAGYSDSPSLPAYAAVQFHATNSYNQVWINGSLSCPASNARVTLCQWFGNGTEIAHAGIQYTSGGHAFWYQLNIYAPAYYGNVWCTPHGNATVNAVTACPGHIG